MSDPHDTPEASDRHAEGYFERNVEEFHREANVLAGHDPRDVTSDPPQNITARRVIVFLVLVIAGLIAAGLAIGLMSIPGCENPEYNWMPCIPDFAP